MQVNLAARIKIGADLDLVCGAWLELDDCQCLAFSLKNHV